MKNLFKLVVAGCAVVLVSCSITGELYPVQGALSKQVPLPVIPMKVEGITGNSGPLSLTLPSGELCKGKWSVVAPQMAGVVQHSSVGSISSGLDSAFVSMHGQSFIRAGVPGINKGQAMLVGDRGSVIECAFLVGSGTASGYGTATDNHGNVFKVVF